MCLYSTTVKPKKADKDITCYKVLIKDRRTGTLRAPVANYTYEPDPNKVYTAERAKRVDRKEITSGYFHTFDHVYTANRYSCVLNRWIAPNHTAVIFKCKIPKGSYYFTGIDNNNRFGFASKKLVLVEEANDLWEPL